MPANKVPNPGAISVIVRIQTIQKTPNVRKFCLNVVVVKLHNSGPSGSQGSHSVTQFLGKT